MKKSLTIILILFITVYSAFAFSFELNAGIGKETFKGTAKEHSPYIVPTVDYNEKLTSYNLGFSGQFKFGLVIFENFSYMPVTSMPNAFTWFGDLLMTDDEYMEYMDQCSFDENFIPVLPYITPTNLNTNILKATLLDGITDAHTLFCVIRNNVGLGYNFKVNEKTDIMAGLSFLYSAFFCGAYKLSDKNVQYYSYGNLGIEATARIKYTLSEHIKLVGDICADYNIKDFTKMDFHNAYNVAYDVKTTPKEKIVFNARLGLSYKF